MTTRTIELAGDGDWWSLEGGGNWASVEGTVEEWTAIAVVLDDGFGDASFKRCAIEIGDHQAALWSPRNAVGRNDYVHVPRADFARLAAQIRRAIHGTTAFAVELLEEPGNAAVRLTMDDRSFCMRPDIARKVRDALSTVLDQRAVVPETEEQVTFVTCDHTIPAALFEAGPPVSRQPEERRAYEPGPRVERVRGIRPDPTAMAALAISGRLPEAQAREIIDDYLELRSREIVADYLEPRSPPPSAGELARLRAVETVARATLDHVLARIRRRDLSSEAIHHLCTLEAALTGEPLSAVLFRRTAP